MLASSCAWRAASKIAPQIGCAPGEVLIPAKLFVECRHKEMQIADCGLPIYTIDDW
jgi:hypothetical protein